MRLHLHTTAFLRWIAILGTAFSICAWAQDEAEGETSEENAIAPPKPIYKVDPKHPDELFHLGIEGQAVIIAGVDMFGSVVDPVVDSATHDEFGLAALLAASEWIFEPATNRGVPLETKVKLPFLFNIAFEHKLNIEMGREVFKKLEADIIPSSDLDKAPLPKFVPAFSDFYPEELADSGISASISVEFIISPSGSIHNPRVISSSASGFEQAAIRAISNMRYNPIEIDGQPVFVSLMMPIQMSE